ncbi:hypothetical protein K7432_007937 [Basidiobolus ranarum]|uniref:Uncharacterized protein n=1 Tax=Basidiobolus ranarum TaxID=34480 RepID=A0ABR2WSQ5_9FUNG
MTDLKSTCLDIFENFKQNGNKWEEVHEEGAQLLSRWAKKAVVEETVFSLKLVLEKFRKLLHSMHHDKHRLLTVLSSLPTESAELAVDHGADRKYPSIVDILDFMSIYLEMYENECLLQVGYGRL